MERGSGHWAGGNGQGAGGVVAQIVKLRAGD